MPPKYSLKPDGNQSIIVEALRAAGAVVHICKLPFDLHVSTTTGAGQPISAYFEVKNPRTRYGRQGPNKNQLETLAKWKGAVHIVDSIETSLDVLKAMRE